MQSLPAAERHRDPPPRPLQERSMHVICCCAICLAGGSGETEMVPFPTAAAAAAQVRPALQTGSLLFSTGDCLAVRVFTHSPYTHVAVAVVGSNGVDVYESVNPGGVRKLPLADFLAAQGNVPVQLVHPCRPLSPAQQQQLTTYLDSQLGRPYAVQHHLSGQRCDGLHCAEYATDALMSVQLIRAERPPRVSPATLRTGVTQHAIYAVGTTLRLTPPPTPPRRNESLCERWWHDTQSCCSNCCRRLRGWFLCQ